MPVLRMNLSILEVIDCSVCHLFGNPSFVWLVMEWQLLFVTATPSVSQSTCYTLNERGIEGIWQSLRT